MGRNLVSVPQLYGTTYTWFAHILPKMGIEVVCQNPTVRGADLEALIDENTRAIFVKPSAIRRQRLRPRGARDLAHRHHMPLIVDNTVATADVGSTRRLWSGHRRSLLDEVHGGHCTTLGGIIVDCGRFHGLPMRPAYPMLTQPDASYHGLVYTITLAALPFIGRCRSVLPSTVGAVLSPMSAFLLLQGIETVGLSASIGMSRMPARLPSSCAPDARVNR